MKILIVAHPDDEVLWFDPRRFDCITIVFGERRDKPGFGERRRKAIAEHPLRNVIRFLDIEEPLLGKIHDGASPLLARYAEDRIVSYLKTLLTTDDLTTHSPAGEYGHKDHILLWRLCLEHAPCRVNGREPDLSRRIIATYKKNDVWTWY